MTSQLAIARKIQDLIDSTIEKTKATERESVLQALADALEEAEKLSDVSEKVLYLNDIANVYAALGSTEKCIEVLNQAFEDAQAIDYDSIKATELSKIGSSYIKLGLTDQGFELLDQALKLAQAIEDVDERDLTLCDVACAYGEVGRSDMALEIASLIEDEFRAAWRVFSPLAQEHLVLEQHDQMLQFIEAAQSTGYEALVIKEVVEACVKIGDYNQPVQLIEMITNPANKIAALGDFAKMHLEAGHQVKAVELLDQACAIAKTIEDRNSRAFAKDIIDSIRAKMHL